MINWQVGQTVEYFEDRGDGRGDTICLMTVRSVGKRFVRAGHEGESRGKLFRIADGSSTDNLYIWRRIRPVKP